MLSLRSTIVPLLIAIFYLPLRYIYTILSFHLSPLPRPFTDPAFVSSASFPSSPSQQAQILREETLYSNSNNTNHVDLDDYERLAFCEDAIVFKLSSEREIGILSCDPSRWEWNTVMGTLVNPYAGVGSLWVVDPLHQGGGGGRGVKRIELDWKNAEVGATDFHPLGLDVHQQSEGGDTLFVINHGANESTIEIFNLRCSTSLDCTARHSRTLSDPRFTGAPNSIAATSPSSFYLSHDHRFNLRAPLSHWKKILNSFETLLALPLSYVDHVSFSSESSRGNNELDGISINRAVSNIAFANGIILSPSGKTLAIASTTTRQVFLYTRNPSTNAVSSKPYRTIKLPFLVDNLSVTSEDFFDDSNYTETVAAEDEEDPFEIIATGHPSFLHLLATAHRSPPFSLSSLLSAPLALVPFPTPLKNRIKEQLSRRTKGWELDWRKTRGLSWSVAITNPPSPFASDGYGPSEKEWRDLFKSSGKNRGQGGYGASSTTIVGKSWDTDVETGGGRWRKWMIVVGLYEEGIKVVMED